MPYLTAADPSPDAFLEAALGAVEGGAAAIEVGIPFSDPVADGPVIQQAHQRALAAGGGVKQSLHLVKRLREETDIPVVLFTYLNPVLSYRVETFARDARGAGSDGLLVLDMPSEEEPDWYDFMADQGLDPILLDSPNTSPERFERMARHGRGFVYVVSREGVTGTHAGASGGLDQRVARLRSRTGLPLAVGFGVTTHAHVASIWDLAECAVVGSAFVDHIRSHSIEPRAESRRFVAGLLGRPDEDIRQTLKESCS